MKNTLEILEKLISFKTVSSNSNLDLIEYISSYLKVLNIDFNLDFNDEKSKANIFFQIGPSTSNGVILSAHTDVVPTLGQKWKQDPYLLTKKNDKFYGRGTCDMKCFIAIILSSLPKMKSARLKKPFQVALSYDEEVGCLGAPNMIKKLQKKLPVANIAIIGEPTSMKVVNSHKASLGFVTEVIGHEVHSSLMHKGISAIMVSSEIIHWINNQNKKNKILSLKEKSSLFDPPYTTLHVGKIKGGTATNITAGKCEFSLDIRCLPNEKPEKWTSRYLSFCKKLENKIKKINTNTSINVENLHWVPGLKPETNSEAESLVRRLTGDNSLNSVSYGTEAGQFQENGYSTIICGPGSIEQAHKANEFISEYEIVKCEKFFKDLILENSF